LKFGDGSLVYAADFFPFSTYWCSACCNSGSASVLDPAKLRFKVEQGGRQPDLPDRESRANLWTTDNSAQDRRRVAAAGCLPNWLTLRALIL
jgi:hypothetical protein